MKKHIWILFLLTGCLKAPPATDHKFSEYNSREDRINELRRRFSESEFNNNRTPEILQLQYPAIVVYQSDFGYWEDIVDPLKWHNFFDEPITITNAADLQTELAKDQAPVEINLFGGEFVIDRKIDVNRPTFLRAQKLKFTGEGKFVVHGSKHFTTHQINLGQIYLYFSNYFGFEASTLENLKIYSDKRLHISLKASKIGSDFAANSEVRRDGQSVYWISLPKIEWPWLPESYDDLTIIYDPRQITTLPPMGHTLISGQSRTTCIDLSEYQESMFCWAEDTRPQNVSNAWGGCTSMDWAYLLSEWDHPNDLAPW